jgi:uncharacterized membrane protein
MSKFNDVAGGGGGDVMVPPLKNDTAYNRAYSKNCISVLPYSLLLSFCVIFIAFNPKICFFWKILLEFVVNV